VNHTLHLWVIVSHQQVISCEEHAYSHQDSDQPDETAGGFLHHEGSYDYRQQRYDIEPYVI